MSFDIYFLPRGIPWQESMDALERAAEDDSVLSEEGLATWVRVESRVRALIPNAQPLSSDDSRQLSDDESGIQLTLFGAEFSLTVPYWYDGESADRIVDLLKMICEAVEGETGLVGYDPQADGPFLDGGSSNATATFDEVRAAFERNDGALTPEESLGRQEGSQPGPIPPSSRQKWWKRRR